MPLILISCASKKPLVERNLCAQGEGVVEASYNGASQKFSFSLKKTTEKILVGIELPLVEEVFFINKDGTVSKNFEKFTSAQYLPKYLLKKIARWIFHLFEKQKREGSVSSLELPSNTLIRFEPIDGNNGSFVVTLMKRVLFINSSYGELIFKFSSCDKISRF